jgi:hypothetical protein
MDDVPFSGQLVMAAIAEYSRKARQAGSYLGI